MTRESPDIPHSMRKVCRRFERWRSAHAGRRVPIPKRLWAAAAELARQHGVFPTAKVLRLEYGKLKQLVEAAGPVARGRGAKAPAAAPRRARSAAPPAFVELLTVPGGRSGGLPDRVGRAARQDAHSVERDDRAGPGWAEPGVLGNPVIQIAPQMRILVTDRGRGWPQGHRLAGPTVPGEAAGRPFFG